MVKYIEWKDMETASDCNGLSGLGAFLGKKMEQDALGSTMAPWICVGVVGKCVLVLQGKSIESRLISIESRSLMTSTYEVHSLRRKPFAEPSQPRYIPSWVGH